jgi:1-deoxy-D-xylulose-5-phosphate reductoisomerase
MKRVLVLGSTGSIGVQALDVISRDPELCVVGLSCGRQTGLLLEQATVHGVADVAIADDHAEASSLALYPELRMRRGADAAARLVREVECDLVLNAIVGFAGLESTVAALECHRPLALANKESLVSGGRVVTALAARAGMRILPVDSEHSALFQLLAAEDPAAVVSIVLTASGGPFRGRKAAELVDVGPEDALAHPTWDMGAKISIDSATLMNKGLEIIEAHHLFDVAYDRIEVVVHPQSLVHSLVRLVDGALLAHLGVPDMRVPIGYALRYPQRRPLPVTPLDLVAAGRLDFSPPDAATFRCLALARDAGVAGDAATCALNAANEIAVHAFLDRRLPFLGIAEVVERVLDALVAPEPRSYDEVVAVDAWARRAASGVCSASDMKGSC